MILASPIETSRLILRTLDPWADVSARYLSWLCDPEIIRHMEIRFTPVSSTDELVSFVRQVNVSPDNMLLGIFLNNGQRHIGNIKLGPIQPYHRRAEIGFIIGEKDCWGQGYATEAISALSSYGLENFGVEKITSGCYADNIGSAKALMKAGFVHEATIPSHVLFEGRRIASLLFGMDAPQN